MSLSARHFEPIGRDGSPLASPGSRPPRIRCALLCLTALLALAHARPAPAGVHAGGVLVLNDSQMAASSDLSTYCGATPCYVPATPGEVDVHLDPPADFPGVYKVYAAFPATAQPRLTQVTFGIQYDPGSIEIFDNTNGPCGDEEIRSWNWPAPGSGTTVRWTTPRLTTMVEVYWFLAIGYDGAVISLIPHPELGGTFTDDSNPPVVDPIHDYGSLGFATDGYLPVPVAP